MKAKTGPEERQDEPGIGDAWTWTAIDPDSKLICTWLVCDRTGESANQFIADLAGRLANRVQITTDGHGAYLTAIGDAFGSHVDYAVLAKGTATTRPRTASSALRWS
jgi:transposase-like protein